MNKVILMGRLTRDPIVRYSSGENPQAVARYTLAVDRRFRRQNDDQTADFISCVAFGRQGEFAEKYLHQGTKIVVSGRLQTGSYTKNDGTRVYTTDVVIEEQDFAESKSVSSENAASYQPPQGAPAPAPAQASGGSGSAPAADPDGFMNIPDGIDEELPFQ
ncbi:MAG: single-stranded DNA-binding protein [Lachnospiraceae bacterium]|jgi:single-strand DNA-binding protein|nr:single-stranded DNA-binding protein [Lachnospiraceae bacterium]MDD7048100.1 single-stranded DNA-binding protein [Lachnospiraceae bacterium]HBB60172.1 single-stranded DNA-binding protein [Lachnospiraceae bacterium]